MDWFILLTPLLVLGVILLLGFTGCDKIFSVPFEPPERSLTLQVRVPSSVTVREHEFRWLRPMKDWEPSPNLETIDEGTGIVIYQFVVPPPIAIGMWRVECKLKVKGMGDSAKGEGDFVFYDTDPPICSFVFSTEGTPSTNDFKITPLPGHRCVEPEGS